MTGWITAAASGAHATAGTEIAALAICGTMGTCLIIIGRMQRRTGRTLLQSDRPFEYGGVLHQPAPPRRSRRITGGFFEGCGWLLAVIGVLNGIIALSHALS